MGLESHSFSGGIAAWMLGDVELSAIGPPFPEWYVPGMQESTKTLTGSSPVSFDRIRTVSQAKDYAVGSWKVTQGKATK